MSGLGAQLQAQATVFGPQAGRRASLSLPVAVLPPESEPGTDWTVTSGLPVRHRRVRRSKFSDRDCPAPERPPGPPRRQPGSLALAKPGATAARRGAAHWQLVAVQVVRVPVLSSPAWFQVGRSGTWPGPGIELLSPSSRSGPTMWRCFGTDSFYIREEGTSSYSFFVWHNFAAEIQRAVPTVASLSFLKVSQLING
jgi:hypothetical protein